jgi:hypothetical protein
MVRRTLILVPLLAASLAIQAQAGILFKRSHKGNQKDAVGDDVKILRTEPDERKRMAAAKDLGDSDPKDHPNAQAALLESLLRDPSPSVRYEVVQSLGKMKPLTTQAAAGLEYALTNDASPQVRIAARNSLAAYLAAGYRGPASYAPAPQTRGSVVDNRASARPEPVHQTQEPPLATIGPAQLSKPAELAPDSAKPAPLPIPATGSASPMETKAEPKPPAKPAPAPAKPAKPADDDGPILIPPA